MLSVLRTAYRPEPAPESIVAAPLKELWEISGFGAAATYECRDWLAEHGLHHTEIEDWIAGREGVGFGDPRMTRDPSDYSYDAQSERIPFF